MHFGFLSVQRFLGTPSHCICVFVLMCVCVCLCMFDESESQLESQIARRSQNRKIKIQNRCDSVLLRLHTEPFKPSQEAHHHCQHEVQPQASVCTEAVNTSRRGDEPASMPCEFEMCFKKYTGVSLGGGPPRICRGIEGAPPLSSNSGSCCCGGWWCPPHHDE